MQADKLLCASHVLCKVDDVHASVRALTAVGFTVEWGKRPDKAHNAFVRFRTGPFIEFFSLSPRVRAARVPLRAVLGVPLRDRILRWAAADEGWCDIAVEIAGTDLRGTRPALAERGVELGRAVSGSRRRPDGVRVSYQFAAPVGGPDLPFVVSQYDPPQHPASIVHPNGASAVRTVVLEVSAAHRDTVEAMIGDDRYVTIVPGDSTRVRSVRLDGLRDALQPVPVRSAELLPGR